MRMKTAKAMLNSGAMYLRANDTTAAHTTSAHTQPPHTRRKHNEQARQDHPSSRVLVPRHVEVP